MIVRTLATVVFSAILVGCSSQPKVQAEKPQYCYTNQTIETENREVVNSRTLIECTDDQLNRLTAKRLGMANNCGEFLYWTKVGGRDVQRKGISCQKLDGSWEIVNTVR
jgi:hypothetical protein